jgi:two-component system, OmpR family, response regulator MprA
MFTPHLSGTWAINREGTMSAPAKPVVLLADDNKDTREFLMEALGTDKYEFIEASNGAEAVQRIKEGAIHLAIIDEVMPKMPGSKVVGIVRASGFKSPILIITGLRSNEIAFELGTSKTSAVMILEKPFKPQQLVDIVRTLMTQFSNAA